MTTIGGIDLIAGTIAAFGALLVYDVFFVTFEDEVTLFWPTPWNFGKILFFLNRYLPFFDTFLSLHLLTGGNTSTGCLVGFRAVTWLIVTGIIISEIILGVRTAALWGGTPTVKTSLILISIAAFLPALVVTQIETMSFAYKGTHHGCSKAKASSPIIFVGFLLLIVYETTIVILTILRARQHHRSQELRSSFVRTIYKDGLMFYVYLLTFSIANLVIAVAAPPEYANWLTTPQRVFHSLLCTRVLSHIRQHNISADENAETLTDLAFTTVRANPPPTGSSSYPSSFSPASPTASGSSSSGTQNYQSFAVVDGTTVASASADHDGKGNVRGRFDTGGDYVELQDLVSAKNTALFFRGK